MIQNRYSLLLCAFLAATFFNGRNAQGGPIINASTGLLPLSLPPFALPPRTSNGAIELTLISFVECIEIQNRAADVSLIIDTSANQILLIDGKDNSLIILSLSSQEGVYINNGIDLSLIRSVLEEGGIEGVLNSLSNTQINGGTGFNLSSVGDDVLDAASKITVQLIKDTEIATTIYKTVGLELITSISTRIVTSCTGKLKGLTESTRTEVKLPGDLAALDNTLKGLEVIVNATGETSLESLREATNLDVKLVLQASDGFTSLTIIADALITSDVKLDGIAEILNNQTPYHKLVAQLGGTQTSGIDGVMLIGYELFKKIDGGDSSPLVGCIIQYLSEEKDRSESLLDELNEKLSKLSTVLQKKKSLFSERLKSIDSFAKGDLVLGGVNISVVGGLLLGPIEGKGLNILVQVVSELKPVVDLKTGVATITLDLIAKLDSSVTWKQVQDLVPEADISSVHPANPKHNLETILANIDIKLVKTDLYGALIKVSIVKEIITKLSTELSAVLSQGGNKENSISGEAYLKKVLNSNSETTKLIKGVIQISTWKTLQVTLVSNAVVKESKVVLVGVTSIEVVINVEVTVKIKGIGDKSGNDGDKSDSDSDDDSDGDSDDSDDDSDNDSDNDSDDD